MIHGVVAPAVSALLYLFKQMRIALNVIAYKEECCLYTVIIEEVQYPRSYLGYRAVVECKVYHLAFLTLYAPHRFGKQNAVEQWRLFDKHVSVTRL